MSDSIVSQVCFLILILVAVFVGPIYQTFETNDELISTIAVDVINNHQKIMRKNGYIDQKSYLELLEDLNRTGEVYTVTITHTSRLAYPGKEAGEYEVHEIKYSNDIILNTIKDGSTKYTMRYGDDIKIDIKETKVAPSRMLLSIFSNTTPKLMSHCDGGMIENEVYE